MNSTFGCRMIVYYVFVNVHLRQYIDLPFSTTSSGQNSLAATFLADIARPIYHQCTRRHLGIKRSTLVAEVTGVYSDVTTSIVIIMYTGVKCNIVN